MDYKVEKLKNGITLLTLPIADAESAVVNFFVKTGSRHEAAKQRGISHFLEHLLFKGTKKYPTAKILSSTVEAIGAEYNAATSKEYTLYYIKAAAEHLELIFDVLSDMLFRPRLEGAEIEREKGVIIEEMNMYRDTPMRYVPDLLEEAMWSGTDLGAQIIGDEKTVTGISRQDLLAYIGSQYVNENLIVAVAGKFEDKKLRHLISKYCDGGRNGRESSYEKASLNGKRILPIKLQYKNTEQAHLALGFYGLNFEDANNPALDLLSNILGGGMSSRLFSEIRERRGLAYYVRMSPQHYQDTGLVSINAGLRINKVEEAISVISQELKKIRLSKVPSAELKKARENLKGRITLSLEDYESRLDWYLEQAAFRKKIWSPKEYFRKIQVVTPQQIQKLANRLFRKENSCLALIGPFRNQDSKLSGLIKL
ncbi:MAG: pitrilysin family protein [Patescibacteria group bacterium]